jgi:hypothetical protein
MCYGPREFVGCGIFVAKLNALLETRRTSEETMKVLLQAMSFAALIIAWSIGMGA